MTTPDVDTQARNGASGRFGCSKCGASWSGCRIEHCTLCHETFSCTATGDLHRTGDHGVKDGPNRRRCRTTEEMLALRNKAGQPRLKISGRGVWVGVGVGPWGATAVLGGDA